MLIQSSTRRSQTYTPSSCSRCADCIIKLIMSVQGWGLYLQVEEGAQHRLAHPLLLCCALVEHGGVLLARATEGVAIPPIHAACKGAVGHVVAVGSTKIPAPVLQHAQPVLQVGEGDTGTEEGCLGCNIPAEADAGVVAGANGLARRAGFE